MAYNVQSLTNYTNEQNFPILKASILGAKSAQLFFYIQTGIKSSAALNMDVDVIQNDSVGSAVTEGGGDVVFHKNDYSCTYCST
jgi:hypothetical protein